MARPSRQFRHSKISHLPYNRGMQEIQSSARQLVDEVQQAFEKLDIESKTKQLTDMQERMAAPDYWQQTDNLEAQKEAKRAADLEALIAPWQTLRKDVNDIVEFTELGDESMSDDLRTRLQTSQETYQQLRGDLRFSGEHDSQPAVMTIQAGAGGLDAQDWAQMLMRMYTRWAEAHDKSMAVLSESYGDEGGIKSVALKFEGPFAYGLLKGEHGVHRLVRLSPFNSANSRETSFAMVEVIPEIEASDIELDESDLRVDVYRAGGHGGQSVNTTDSAVRITHEPTGIVVSIQNERSQTQNKETAMKVLKSRLAQLAEEQHQEKVSDLKGPNQEAAWGNQIRSYVLHPYTMVKDSRSNYSTSDVQAVLEGGLDELIDAYLDATLSA